MTGFFEALWARPAELGRLSRYIVWNGVLYMVLGGALFLSPKPILELQLQVKLQGFEVGLSNALGMTLLVIGWFYFMGGRTGRPSFGLATVVDRMLVPFFLGSLVLRGLVAPMMAVPFMILDPLLGLGALFAWRREQAERG